MDWSGVDYCDVFISCLDSQSDGTHPLHMNIPQMFIFLGMNMPLSIFKNCELLQTEEACYIIVSIIVTQRNEEQSEANRPIRLVKLNSFKVDEETPCKGKLHFVIQTLLHTKTDMEWK